MEPRETDRRAGDDRRRTFGKDRLIEHEIEPRLKARETEGRSAPDEKISDEQRRWRERSATSGADPRRVADRRGRRRGKHHRRRHRDPEPRLGGEGGESRIRPDEPRRGAERGPQRIPAAPRPRRFEEKSRPTRRRQQHDRCDRGDHRRGGRRRAALDSGGRPEGGDGVRDHAAIIADRGRDETPQLCGCRTLLGGTGSAAYTRPRRTNMAQTTDGLFDVLVVGGGPVGHAAALAFAGTGRRTAVLAAARPSADGRTVALMQPALRFLEAIGAGAATQDATPLERLAIIDDTGSLFRPPPVTFAASEIGLDRFGGNVVANALAERLADLVAADGGIALLEGRATGLADHGDHACVETENGVALRARLVVAADGRRSVLRDALGIETRETSYPQSAVTAILAHDRPHRETSTEFHTRTGPFTLVPLEGRRSSLVWLTKPEHAETLVAMDAEQFGRTVERQARSMLGAMRLDGPRGTTPMKTITVSRFAAGRTALTGEAAHAFPPIGAQGLNLGLADIEALVAAADRSEDPGARAVLEAYDQGRRKDVGTRTTAVDALNRSLLTAMLPVDFARGAGLLALGAVAPLRRLAMRRGLAG